MQKFKTIKENILLADCEAGDYVDFPPTGVNGKYGASNITLVKIKHIPGASFRSNTPLDSGAMLQYKRRIFRTPPW